MALDRQGTGLAITRILIGVFLIFMGYNKLAWLTDSTILGGQLSGWLEQLDAGSPSAWYLRTVAIPGAPLFARLVPLGELISGLALVFGFWTRPFALLAFLMVLNFQFASGLLFRYAFLTNGYCLPVLGSTLGLAVGGTRLPLSISK